MSFFLKTGEVGKISISQEHIGPLILEKLQTNILTSVNLLYTLCYEIPCIRDRVLCSGMHFINFKIFFHPAKFDSFKDETISDYKTVSVPQSQIFAGLKTLGLVGL